MYKFKYNIARYEVGKPKQRKKIIIYVSSITRIGKPKILQEHVHSLAEFHMIQMHS